MKLNSKQIKKIYTQYFEIIDSFFGAIKHRLGKEIDSHTDLGFDIANYPLISDLMLDAIEGLDEEIKNFWGNNAKNVMEYIKAQDTMKCLYSGNLTPSTLENFVKRSSIYVDSIIIPDPLYNIIVFQEGASLDKKYYLNMLIRNVFNVWKVKDLILADSETQILLILPINLSLIKDDDRGNLMKEADDACINYINNLTGYKADSIQDVMSFFTKFNTSEKLFLNFQNKGLLPNELQKLSSFDGFMTNFGKMSKSAKIGRENANMVNFASYTRGQFIRSYEHKLFCDKLAAIPIYDYELPWFFFNYQIGGGGMDYAISNSLQKDSFEWITNIPLSLVKKVREDNRLEDMRSCLRIGMNDLKAKNDTDLIKTSEQLEKNFKEAFKKQEAEISYLKQEISRIDKDTTIDMGITSFGALMSYIPGIGSTVNLVTASRDVKKILAERNKIGENKDLLSKSESGCVSILMEAHDKK